MYYLKQLALTMAMAAAASAAMVHPDSYSLFNGGISDIAFGDINFVDETYTGGTGDPLINYDLLEGGLGDLTDGIVSPDSWNVSSLPWVGWSDEFDINGANPTISFFFGQVHVFQMLRIHVDDTDGLMNAETPGTVEVSDGLLNLIFAIPDGGSGPQWFDLDITGLGGDALSLTLNQRAGYHWVFLDEVEFQADGANDPVPEPGTWSLVGIVLAGAGLMLRARR
ncbi:MAG: PEP-CTERM sorting domain-containing protein [Bryobacteraceae bacterium]